MQRNPKADNIVFYRFLSFKWGNISLAYNHRNSASLLTVEIRRLKTGDLIRFYVLLNTFVHRIFFSYFKLLPFRHGYQFQSNGLSSTESYFIKCPLFVSLPVRTTKVQPFLAWFQPCPETESKLERMARLHFWSSGRWGWSTLLLPLFLGSLWFGQVESVRLFFLFNWVKTHDYYQIRIVIWNHIIAHKLLVFGRNIQ